MNPLADRLRALPPEDRAAVFDAVETELGVGALHDVRYDFEGFWLRDHQIVTEEELSPPDAQPPGLVVFTGPRGDGKTMAAITLFDRLIRQGKAERPRLFAATEGDVDKVVVHGVSGIMSLYSKRDPNRPIWIAGEGPAGVLRYPGGVEVLCFSAKVSEGAVAHAGDLDLYDDVAKWGARAFDAWAHARASCRIGMALGVVATTRRGTHLLRRLLKDDLEGVLIKRGGDLEANRFNLSEKMYNQRRKELGENDFVRQEFDDEDISASSPFVGFDFDSAPIRILSAPREDFTEIIVAVDPADGKGGDHDEWGIGAAGRRHDRHVVALEDASGSYDEDEAAAEALRLCEAWGATTIIAENNRCKHVRAALRAAHFQRELEAMRFDERDAPRPLPKIVGVNAKDGKALRAGPLRVLYAQGTLHHVAGLRLLEKQQREWDPDGPRRPRQDDRIDWLVHAVHYLADLGALGGVRIEHVAGIADRVRKMQGAPSTKNQLQKSDKVPAGDPRSSFRPRKFRAKRKKAMW